MLSAQSADTGLRDFRQYFIASNLDQLYLLHNQVGDIDDDRATQDYIDCTNFALDNHFTSHQFIFLKRLDGVLVTVTQHNFELHDVFLGLAVTNP